MSSTLSSIVSPRSPRRLAPPSGLILFVGRVIFVHSKLPVRHRGLSRIWPRETLGAFSMEVQMKKDKKFLVPPELLKLIEAQPDDLLNEKRLEFVERSRKKLPPRIALL
jgi:hypothetical protein